MVKPLKNFKLECFSLMASFITIRFYILTILITCAVIIGCTLAKDDDYEPEVGSVGQNPVNCDTGHEYLGPDECNDEIEKDPEHGIGDEGFGHNHDHEDPEIGASGGDDAPHIVASALTCLNEKHIYRDCDESFRLTVSGELHVPPEHVDEFCSGSCLDETNLVLHCLDGIMDHFVFYNKATTQDVRDTILAGCSYGDERGDFDVAEHIQSDGGGESVGHKGATKAVFGIFITFIAFILLF